MKKIGTWITLGIIAILVIVFLSTSLVILDETQQGAIVRFGDIKKIITEPGIYFKTPFVDNVLKFEKRIMLYDIDTERVITQDKKTIVVDTYSIWRISNPQTFIESMRTINNALTRIDDVVYSHVRDVIAKYTFEEILSKKRLELLEEIKVRSEESLKTYGINIVDVRVKRTDLPDDNRKAVYERMNAERYSIAAQIRAEGEKEGQKIRAEADKEKEIILSQANRDAKIIMGTADASALNIYADAYNEDSDFYELQRLTTIYKESLNNSVISIPLDSPLMRYFYEVE
ncbi:protease modulator HflC [Geotoga petraea]|jgi:membrane protease subunit HflC|uniref:Protein HflC n=1 Tax=Geotoga petraea TaxID=28234 RepID=A0A1G6N213_9BACT|nr:protease modulator HflC [Geotoga petraea]MDK2946203.1 modulator of FtsH protease HflC [Geotoga sp.]TGG87262.1 protease modulator HflC [Geotoga petraea]SDC61862.1 protease FtsH subunit HflC [Geotoga petraea]